MCSLSLFFADVLTYKLWTPQRANKTTYKYKQIFTLLLRAFNMTIYFTHFFRISFAHPLKRWAQSNKATSKSTVIQFSNALWLLCLLCESNRFFFPRACPEENVGSVRRIRSLKGKAKEKPSMLRVPISLCARIYRQGSQRALSWVPSHIGQLLTASKLLLAASYSTAG